jgi:SAM-dependent methyltransferase
MSQQQFEDPILARYLGPRYAERNPSWDRDDSEWKAGLVRDAIERAGLRPGSIADVGCGSGGVLAALRPFFPEARLCGFDVAPGAARLWDGHAGTGIRLVVGDFLAETRERYDVVLLLDVLEHLANPFEFLVRLRSRAGHFVLHFPLDLSALSVLREAPLLAAREKVGHLHYYTKSLALALLEDCGYRIVDVRYTGATFTAPPRSWRSRLAGVVRRVGYAVHHDLAARLLGGETLIVLATVRDAS